MTGATPLANGRILPIGESIIGKASRLKKILQIFLGLDLEATQVIGASKRPRRRTVARVPLAGLGLITQDERHELYHIGPPKQLCAAPPHPEPY
jgi:hypothetical protein